MYSVCQLGARMNYAVAKALHKNNILSRFYTDICADTVMMRLMLNVAGHLGLDSTKRLSLRQTDIPTSLIFQYPLFGLQYYFQRRNSNSMLEDFKNYIFARKKFNKLIINDLKSDNAEYLYVFNTCALEIINSNLNRKIVLEQCSLPIGAYLEKICNEEEKYPEWTTVFHRDILNDQIFLEYKESELLELQTADRIITPSLEVANSLHQLHIKAEKIELIPYGFNFKKRIESRALSSCFTVATIGVIELRKGFHHFARIACACSFAHFTAIGAIGNSFPSDKLDILKQRITFSGHLSRTDLLQEFQKIDVILLLTLGEGSATVVYEALSLGIPVITTSAAGSIVEDGLSGYIVNPEDDDTIVNKLKLLSDPDHYRVMSAQAILRSQYGSNEAYGNRLIHSLKSLER